ncbi:MAG TPA: 50S ribosomal protein L4 [Candidatus Acidoferrales bacterium]|jgi:large subunit ribosomal protein L4|nr:50S ribosomal protein L4 [Candidatus Acidoferrales bacterium]
MSTARVVDGTGAVTGTLELAPAVFDADINVTVMHQALLRQLNNARQGTHSTLTRGKVRGGGRKPYRQKGTGRARQGSIRAPQWTGGGIVFGPHPRSYRQDMPRKQRRLALRGALTAKAREEQLVVLGDLALEAPRTRAVVDLIRTAEAGARVLLVLGTHNEILEKSARNIPEVRVTLAGNISVRDLLTAETVMLTPDAIEHITEFLS